MGDNDGKEVGPLVGEFEGECAGEFVGDQVGLSAGSTFTTIQCICLLSNTMEKVTLCRACRWAETRC